jgi:hypothetical protein
VKPHVICRMMASIDGRTLTSDGGLKIRTEENCSSGCTINSPSMPGSLAG